MSIEALDRACATLKKLDRRSWKSETARLAAVVSDVEHAIETGLSVGVVHQKLRDAGLILSFQGFQSARKRIKKRGTGTPRSEPKRSGSHDRLPEREEGASQRFDSMMDDMEKRHAKSDARLDSKKDED